LRTNILNSILKYFLKLQPVFIVQAAF